MDAGYGGAGRYWGPHREQAGVEGQGSLAVRTGSEIQYIDPQEKRGDGGVDLWPLMNTGSECQFFRADAKGVWKKPVYLLIPTRDLVIKEERRIDPINGKLQPGAVRPDTIYIQFYRHPGQDENENNIELGPWPCNGFAWGHEVMKYPAEWYDGNSGYVHVVPSWGERSVLHPWEEFMAMYCNRWRIQNFRERIAIYCEDVTPRGGGIDVRQRMAAVPQSGDHRDAPLPGG